MSAERVRAALSEAAQARRTAHWATAAKRLDRVSAEIDSLGEAEPARVAWMVATAEAVQILGGTERARVMATEALRLAEEEGLEVELCVALRVLGTITWRTGDLRAGRTLLERALDRANALRDADGAVRCCVELSHVALDQGRLDDAEELLRRGMELAGDDPILALLPRAAWANTFQRRADRASARSAYEVALKASRKVGHLLVEGMCQHGLANLALEEGDLRMAVARVREAHKAYSRAGYVFGEAQCYNVLGEAHRKGGEVGPAIRAYERAIRAGDAVGHPQLVPRANLAVLRMEAGRLGDAKALIEEVLAVADARGLRPIVASMHALLLPCVADDDQELSRHLVRAAQGLDETGVYDRDLANAARLAAERCRPELAARCRALALQQLESLGDAAGVRAERQALWELAEAGAPVPAGPFDLIEPLGSGAMGEVWSARHRLGFDAAVKVVAAAPKRERLLEMLEGEARAVVGLDHPSVVRLIDYGNLGPAATAMRSRLHTGAPWFAMERIDGGDLEALCGKQPWERCRSLLLQLLDALGHAHSRGVLHLDVKPANVLLTTDPVPRAKLVDFGLAAALQSAGGKVRVAGTPLYMAPEQFRGEPRDWGPWTDLYALGCLAVHLVCGEPPFGGTELREIREAHLRGEARIEAPEDVPAGFATWALGLLAKEPADRFRFASDAAEALRWIEEGGETAPIPLAPEAPRSTPERARSGLALFDLRTPPMIGRAEEQRRLWTALRDVITQEEPQVVVLRGGSGVGKSALARWLSEKAHAEGRASTLRAPAAAERPIGALVEDRLRIERLSLEEAERRIAQREASLDESSIGALAELGTGQAGEGFRMGSAVGAFVRLVESDCEDRPVVLHVEGSVVQHPEVLQLAQAVLASGLSVLLLLELRPEELPSHGRGGDAWSIEGARVLDVPPLPEAEVRSLLDAMLPCDPALAVALVERADGNPRLALHLLGSLIRRDAVAVGPSGVGLRSGVRLDLPDDLVAVWRDRLDEVLGGLGEDAWLILSIGALLGARVRMSDWRVACEVAGVSGMSTVLRRLRVARLAVPTADRGLSFAHPVLRDAILAVARDRGLLAEASRGAAAGPSLADEPGRRGELLVDAGELAEAEPLLREGAKRALDVGDVIRARQLAERCADALRALGTALDAPRWTGLHLLLCRIAIEDADHREGERHAERALALAERHGMRLERAAALRWIATADWIGRRADLALDGFRDALAASEGLDDPVGQARCHHGISVVMRARARYAEALDHLERARELLMREGDADLLAGIWCTLGDVRLRLGQYEASREAFEEGLERARDGRESALVSTALLGLGELARKRGDLDEAERWYREAQKRRRGGQKLKAGVAQLNLALVELERRRWDEADALLGELLDRLDRDRDSAVQMFARVARLPVAAVREEAGWREAVGPVARALEDAGIRDPDIAWCLDLAGERAHGAGWSVRAEECWLRAAEHWEAVGSPEKAARSRERAERA